MNNNDHSDSKSDHPPRARFGGGGSSHGGRSNPFNAIPPLTTGSIASPTAGASTAFGLGSGAFASFGTANKTPKTPGTAFDFGKTAGAVASPSTPVAKNEKTLGKSTATTPGKTTSQNTQEATAVSGELSWDVPAPLKYTWVIWYRPPTSKNSDYEKSTVKMLRMSTAQDFVRVFRHLKRPSLLPTVSDYHFFKEGIRPVWEDEENRKGGKWIMRLKKGVADRYWENLLMALIGNEFMEAGEEVCGAVVSVRSGEDVFSVWTKNDGGRNVKIRWVMGASNLRNAETDGFTGRRSSASCRYRPIRASSGRATTTALHNGRCWTSSVKRKRRRGGGLSRRKASNKKKPLRDDSDL